MIKLFKKKDLKTAEVELFKLVLFIISCEMFRPYLGHFIETSFVRVTDQTARLDPKIDIE